MFILFIVWRFLPLAQLCPLNGTSMSESSVKTSASPGHYFSQWPCLIAPPSRPAAFPVACLPHFHLARSCRLYVKASVGPAGPTRWLEVQGQTPAASAAPPEGSDCPLLLPSLASSREAKLWLVVTFKALARTPLPFKLGGGGIPNFPSCPVGSGPRYMICVTLFCTLRESENTRTCENCTRNHGHARIARVLRAILSCPCAFWLAQGAKTCDKIWYLGPLPSSAYCPGQQYVIVDPLLPIIDLEMMGSDKSIITVTIGNNDLVMIGNNDVITDVNMSNNLVITHVIMSNNRDISFRPLLPPCFSLPPS